MASTPWSSTLLEIWFNSLTLDSQPLLINKKWHGLSEDKHTRAALCKRHVHIENAGGGGGGGRGVQVSHAGGGRGGGLERGAVRAVGVARRCGWWQSC